MATINYRSAKNIPGHVTGVVKKGKTKATTTYAFMPTKANRHPGEKLPVHRKGSKIHGK